MPRDAKRSPWDWFAVVIGLIMIGPNGITSAPTALLVGTALFASGLVASLPAGQGRNRVRCRCPALSDAGHLAVSARVGWRPGC